jgi:hypothetical protein
MTTQFLFYISAATDMEQEREILARSVIDVPADVTWRIELSPRGNDPVDRQAVAQADLHLVLLGGDIRAPVGLEWMAARHFGRLPLPLLKVGAKRTMAAEDFRRFVELQASWLPFANNADLRQQALQLLGARLLDRVTDFGLTPDEIEGLLRWQKDLHQVSGPAEGDMLGGAGESSLIFSKQRHEPSTGILLQPEDDEN